MSDFTFSQLNPDLILDAIETLDIRAESGLLALNSYENRVYQFLAEDRKRYVVKFYRPQRWTNEQIQEEHDFSLELQEAEIPVVAPLQLDNHSAENKQSLHHHKGYRFAIFPSAGGRQFEVDNLDQLEWMGRYIGRIHRVAQAKPFVHRPEIDTASYLDTPKIILQNGSLVPHHLQTAFHTILDMVISETKAKFSASANQIRLHGDLHPGNILWRDGPTFVDLDDCRTGASVQDLWMMLSGDKHQQFIQMDTLIEAYEEFNSFDSKELALIEPLRAMRMVHYMAWLSLRWEDPAFPQAFPWFAEDKYWENQILALKEQYSALQEEPLKL
jgi:Ser/Thr protein kinase RdoA (MazF antagonist)